MYTQYIFDRHSFVTNKTQFLKTVATLIVLGTQPIYFLYFERFSVEPTLCPPPHTEEHKGFVTSKRNGSKTLQTDVLPLVVAVTLLHRVHCYLWPDTTVLVKHYGREVQMLSFQCKGLEEILSCE